VIGCVRDGQPVWYYPVTGGPRFAGVVDGEMWALGHGAAVVNLREMETAYGDYVRLPGRARVNAAGLTNLEPRM
jgi:hypothetical protein